MTLRRFWRPSASASWRRIWAIAWREGCGPEVAAPRLALGIPARNATAHLPRLFESIRRQTVPFDEVLLYDDASSDGTGDMRRSNPGR